MQQKEVKICGGVGRRAGGRLLHRKKFATRGRFRYDKRAAGLPGKSTPPSQVFWGVTGETVVLLSKGMVDTRKVKVDFSLEDMDLSEFTGKATYGQIKTYVLEQTGLKVSSLYIAQIKKKCGLHVGENFNLSKSDNARQPQCTPEKEDAIMQAFRHFGII